MTALMLASLGVAASAPAVMAADEVSVVASGAVQTGQNQSNTFDVVAVRHTDDTVTGSIEIQVSGTPANGEITCLSIDGNSIVVGGHRPVQGPNPEVWFTLYLTDNGPDGTQDTAAFDGPTNMSQPDCGVPNTTQQNLWYGQVSILHGPSEPGSVRGQGTSHISQTYIRTFEFDAQRDVNGVVTGTYSISESPTFQTSGTVVCLDIRGGRAMVVGEGPPLAGQQFGHTYATFFVDDVGPYGSGDSISVNAYTQTSPNECLAAQEYPSDPLISGDVYVNGVGGPGTPPPAATIVATGQVGSGQSSASFDVAAVSDGAGHLDGTIRLSQQSGASVSGTITCLRVDGNQIVVGGQDTHFGQVGTVWFTLWLTDNGPDGSQDLAAFDGPTNMAPPDCSAPNPSQQALSYGQVTILQGAPEKGTLSGTGSYDLGGGATRTFAFVGSRLDDGSASGSFSLTDSGGFGLAGAIDCIDIRGEQATVVGHGSSGGAGTLYAVIFLTDGGANGLLDEISVNTFQNQSPFQCLAAQDSPGQTLTSGDIDINAGATPDPAVTAVAVSPGGTASSGASATTALPVIAAVTSPTGGIVTITDSATTDPPPSGSGYTFVGHQLNITAPAATTATPMTFVFTIDHDVLTGPDPDLTSADVVIFRNGVPVEPCTASTSDDPATPDPCVSMRESLNGGANTGDARVTVLTSAASDWNVGSELVPIAPDAPTGVVGTPGSHAATVTWTAPNDGGSAITSYTVTANPGGQSTTTSSTSATLSGLSNGIPYTFTVTATNDVGTGPASAPSTAVTPTASYLGLRLVTGAMDVPDYGIFQGMTPDGSRMYYIRYINVGQTLELWEWADGQTRHITTGTGNATQFPTFYGAAQDGSRVVFGTPESLVPEDQDAGSLDVYARVGSTNVLLSTSPTQSSGQTEDAAYVVGTSPDMTQVVIATFGHMVEDDTDDQWDLYLRRGTTTTWVTSGPTGGASNENGSGVYTGDARYDAGCDCLHVFFSTIEALVAADQDADYDVYASTDGVLTLVSTGISDLDASVIEYAGASNDGARVLVTTDAALDAEDLNTTVDVYAYTNGTPTLVTSGAPDEYDYPMAVSTDASRVLFASFAALVPEDVDGGYDLYESVNGTFRLITVGPQMFGYGYGWVYRGSNLVFVTNMPLSPTDTDDRNDIYAWDGASTRLVSIVDGGGFTAGLKTSDNGRYAFTISDRPLVPEDQDVAEDVYRYDLATTAPPTLISAAPSVGTYPSVSLEGVSADGMIAALAASVALTDEDIDVNEDPSQATDVYISTMVAGAQDVIPAGGTVSTDDVATPPHPVIASVTSPNAGTVTITESTTTDPPPVGSGYTFIGHQLDISAPPATAADPLTFVFTVDRDLLTIPDPDLTAATITVFRNGVPVGDCSALTTDDPATPDPCVSHRETLSGGADEGDARITVLTSAASSWNFGSGPTVTAPGAPTGVTALRGDRQAQVTWTAAADNGSAILSSLVTASPGGRTATVTGTGTSTIVTGLTNGVAYTFTVRATNSIGQGPASTPSNSVTPGPKLSQTITFAKPANQTLPAAPITVTATASSGLPVTLTSTTTSVCTVAGFTITFVAAGDCSITASQAGNITYKAASSVTRTFSVSKAKQTITFDKPTPKTMLETPFTVVAASDSGLVVTLTSTTTAVCTVAGFDISLLKNGTCSITASQAGNATYKAASAVSRSFSVTKASQTITFPDPGSKSKSLGTVVLSVTASSGLTVVLTSQSTAVCTMSGFTVTLKKTGTCKITANQAGNTIYGPAPAVVRQFAVTN